MPASDWNAVPPGSTWWSAEGQWVWVPTTRLTWPSKEWPNAIFSLVASAWKSTTMAATEAPRRYFASSAAVARNGQSSASMNSRPMALQHQRAPPVAQGHHDAARAGRAGRIVQRPEQARGLGDEGNDFLAVPGVVAEREDVGAGGEQGARHLGRQAEAVRGVLGVDHREIDAQPRAQVGQRGGDGVAAGATDHVAQEQDAHLSLRRQRITPRSVATAREPDVVLRGRHGVHLLAGEGAADRRRRPAGRPACGRR